MLQRFSLQPASPFVDCRKSWNETTIGRFRACGTVERKQSDVWKKQKEVKTHFDVRHNLRHQTHSCSLLQPSQSSTSLYGLILNTTPIHASARRNKRPEFLYRKIFPFVQRTLCQVFDPIEFSLPDINRRWQGLQQPSIGFSRLNFDLWEGAPCCCNTARFGYFASINGS